MEGSEASGHGLVVGKYVECLEIRKAYSRWQQRIAALAKRSPQMGFTSLAYLMDIDWLCGAFYRTRKDGASGVDGQTWDQYAENLEANLQSLLDRAKSGTYRAPPVRRVYIPKAGSTTELRPIGIPTLEDKVLQHAPFLWPKAIFTRHPSQPNLTLPPLQHARPKISRRAPLKPPWPKAILTVAWGTRPRNPWQTSFLWPKAIFTRLPP